MKKSNKVLKLLTVFLLVLLLSGCTQPLRTSKKKTVTNPETGQSITANILCKPTDKKTLDIYEKNKKVLKKDYNIELKKLPECKNYKVMSNGYEGLWTSFFVQPLAWCILKLGTFVKSYGLSLIIVSIIIRLILFPFTKKMAMQSELMKKAQKDMQRIEKKYEGKNDQESMMKKSQEMSMVYKKHGINPMNSCLISFIQIPLLFAFFEAINRTPAIFEDKFLFLQLGTTPMVGISHGNMMYLLLIVLIGATTFFSFKMNAQDTAVNGQMKSMPIIMTVMIIFMGLYMSSALGIYWITTNLFIICQNIMVKRSKKDHGKV